MTRAVLADTGPLLAAVDTDDQFHKRAQADLARIRQERISVLVVSSTLFEAYSLILRRIALPSAQQWLAEFRQQIEIILPTGEDIDDAVELLVRFHDQPITLVDAVLGVVADRSTFPVWTYDHHFDVMRVAVWH